MHPGGAVHLRAHTALGASQRSIAACVATAAAAEPGVGEGHLELPHDQHRHVRLAHHNRIGLRGRRDCARAQ
eukprot:scaffold87952_cov43-Phaeocystis_antarctica.AAC.1